MLKLMLVTLALVLSATPAAAADRLCDPAHEDCRAPLLELIRNERIGIDLAFWFMEDARYTAALEKKLAEGVPIRVIVDTRANSTYPLNVSRLEELKAAGIPMRRRIASGILHWKMMLFEGQSTVQFSAANYTSSFVPTVPYENYIDEAVYFTDDSAVVNSFRTKFDDLWVDVTRYTNYANITGPLLRRYDTFDKDPELNFPPLESYRNRAVSRYDAETTAIDVIMYRITDRSHTDAMIRAMERGVPVRLITEPKQYRDRSRYWHSWNVDRLYAAGAKIRHRAHDGLMHQKSVLLRSQGLTIFGSSNWTSPSSSSQEEHNYFTDKPYFFDWFMEQFERKWHNSTGHAETKPFVPLPPNKPRYVAPGDAATIDTDAVTLTWNGGIWAHLYDIYFGTTPSPPLFAPNQPLGPSTSSSDNKKFVVSGLVPGTTYYWRVVGKTMANVTKAGPVVSFTVGGTSPPPSDGTDIVLYAAHASLVHGNWTVEPDGAAAGGARMANPDAGAAKVTTAASSPTDYFEMTFTAEAGRPYHLWIRGKADRDHYGNDSVHVQFSGSVTASGTPAFRIGTTASTVVCIEAGSGAGLSGWGWADNGWGTLGPHVYFETSGLQTVRVQRREDGVSIDQIVLSPASHLTASPGATKNDTTILPESDGSNENPPPPPSGMGDVVVHASRATLVGTAWQFLPDESAASGAALFSPDRAVPKVASAATDPSSYAEVTFTAEAGQAYRLWVRGRADRNYWGNDSVHVQFSDSVDSTGGAVYRIGTSGSVVINLEDCSGCGVSGWGWQDTGWGTGVLGPTIYFATSGTHTLRIQAREDGLAIDQILLSPDKYLTAAPGGLKNDATILPETP
jgi:phosphatidylserine/phosphatidylglycerophosphate/cardiolipin synthase-like enzyme